MGKKILIIKVGAIGDAVMAFPALLKIRSEEPSAHITWMGGKIIQELVNSLSLVDHYIPIDEKKLYCENKWHRILTLLRVWKENFLKKYDAVYIFHHDKKYRMLSWFSRRKICKSSVRDRYLQLDQYHAFGYLKLYQEPSYPSEEEICYPKLNFSTSYWKAHTLNATIDNRTILLLPGGAKNTLREQSLRRWPIDHYVQLAKLLIQAGWKVVISGAVSDLWIVDSFNHLPVINLVGKNSLVEQCFAIHLAKIFVTHDTGPMHLAKLTMTPTLALFGPVNPMGRYSKRTKDNNISVVWGGEHLSCRPCYDGKDFAPCKRNRCMIDISPQLVFQKIKTMIEKVDSPLFDTMDIKSKAPYIP